MSAATAEQAGLGTVIQSPVIPDGSPTAATSAPGPVIPDQTAQPTEPVQPGADEWIEIPRFDPVTGQPNPDGGTFTRINRADVPKVIMDNQSETYRARREAESARQQLDFMRQQQMSQAPPQPDFRQQRLEFHIQQGRMRYPNADSDALRQWADDRVETEMSTAAMVQQATQQAYQNAIGSMWQSDYEQIKAADPTFNKDAQGSLAETVFRAYPGEGPRQHYARYLALTGRGTGTQAIPQAMQDVLRQAQDARNRQVALPQGGGMPQGRTAAPNPMIEQALQTMNEVSFKGKATPEQLADIRHELESRQADLAEQHRLETQRRGY